MARTAVVAGTASTVAGRVNRRQQQKWAAQDAQAAPQQQYAQPQGYAEPQAAPAGEDRIQKLKDLGALKQQGVLTDAEFEAEKARILGG
jgi:hypothetical protein